VRPLLLCVLVISACAQTVPQGWKVIHDGKMSCQIAVPPDWTPFTEGSGAAVFHDATTAIAVVTSQPGQTFKPLTESQLRMLGVVRERIFENSAKRLFYQDRVAPSSDDSNAFSAMVPGKDGTCSCHIVFGRDISEDTARKITLSVGPVPEQKSTVQPPPPAPFN
jgi:hypothetical protein